MLREVIIAELKRQNLSRYWLARRVELSSPNTIYQYLRGEIDLRGYRISELLDILGLEIKPTVKASTSPSRKKVKKRGK